MKQYVLIKGTLDTGEKIRVGSPQDTPFTEEANALNADHFIHIRKLWKGHYEGDGTGSEIGLGQGVHLAQ